MVTNAIAKQASTDAPILSDLCADAIEQCIIRAYVRLVFQAVDTDNSRPTVVVRLGALEVHLSETHPEDTAPGPPRFWIEVFDGKSQVSIDSIGCHEFDEGALAAAVEMIVSAAGSRSLDDAVDPLNTILDRTAEPSSYEPG
jgi:hypothetical protein